MWIKDVILTLAYSVGLCILVFIGALLVVSVTHTHTVCRTYFPDVPTAGCMMCAYYQGERDNK